MFQLFLNAFSVISVVLAEELDWTMISIDRTAFNVDSALFAIALLSTSIISVLAFANPMSRWHKLRAAATQLQSKIWLFRTRCGPFQMQSLNFDSDVEEKRLEKELTSWRKAAVQETDLQRSDFQRQHPMYYFTHGQYKPDDRTLSRLRQRQSPPEKGQAFFKWAEELLKGNGYNGYKDDHHSPVQPSLYVQLRLRWMIEFYQKRLPGYARYNRLLFFMSIVSVSLSSVLAFFGFTRWVIVGTTLSSASSSWSEFLNVQQSIQRYSDTIMALKNLESWWNSLTQIERAAIPNIEHLIHTTEDIIKSECEAWARAQKQQEGKASKWAVNAKAQPKSAAKK